MFENVCWEYTEQEVNEILKDIYNDFAYLRRGLIDSGLLKREGNGCRDWKES